MNVNVYLPEELGQRAKEANLPFSNLLQRAVDAELQRIAAVKGPSESPVVYEFELLDSGESELWFTGRVTGRLLAKGDRFGGDTVEIYLTTDERVIVHESAHFSAWTATHPAEELRSVLDTPAYVRAMRALGINPVIDL